MTDANGATLLRRVGHSMFWNAALLPLISVLNLGSAILIRRYFGLESGLYDILIGLTNTLVFWAALGIPESTTLFVPQLESAGARHKLVQFVRRSTTVSLVALTALLVPLNLLAVQVAGLFDLGANGAILVYLVSALAVLRTLNNLQVKALQGLLRHMRANLLQLALAVGTAAALAVTFSAGRGMAAVLVAIGLATVLVLIPGGRWLRRAIREVPEEAVPARAASGEFSAGVPASRFWRFCLFMYGYSWFDYFVRPAFASPAIIAAGGTRSAVALFNVGYQLPFMAIVLVASSLNGLYRPLFSRLIADPVRLRTAFAEVSKVQIVLLLPAGAGLAVMAGDIIPLVFGPAFTESIPLARVFCVLLFAETILNLGSIILSVDHRYRQVTAAMSLRLIAMPFFIWFATRDDLVSAAAAFGVGRFLSVLVGYWQCRQTFGVRFPVAFLARASAPSLIMVTTLASIRQWVPPSWPELVGLVGLGVVIVALSTRWLRVLSDREIDLLHRAAVPGAGVITAVLAPRAGRSRSD